MGVQDDLADKLARKAIAASQKFKDPDLIDNVGKQLAASSSTMEEVYLTYVRMHLSVQRANQFLDDYIARSGSGTTEA